MKEQKGQTLIEILLAFSVLVLVLGAVVFGITTSLSNTQYTKNQGLANSYAQEGMAVIRQMRYSSWNTFRNSYTNNTTYCLNQDYSITVPPALGCVKIGVIFSREVKFEYDSLNCSAGIPPTPTPTPAIILNGNKVTITVSWSGSKCPASTPLCNKVELITCFSSIDPTPTP